MMLSCKKATLLTELKEEGKTTSWQNAMLRFHLFMCKNCSSFEKQFKWIKKACQKEDIGFDNTLSTDQKNKLETILKK